MPEYELRLLALDGGDVRGQSTLQAAHGHHRPRIAAEALRLLRYKGPGLRTV